MIMKTHCSVFSLALLASMSLAKPAAADETSPASTEGASATDSSADADSGPCDLNKAYRWSLAAQTKIEKSPDKHLKSCPQVSAYAAATIEVSQTLPGPCSKFASLANDRQEVARYNWAYGSIVEVFQEKGKAKRAERIAKGLEEYNKRFAAYESKISEYRELCVKVHAPGGNATSADIQKWSMSGRIMLSAVQNKVEWERGGVKASLDSSFKGVADALR
jgi:hypothetical protein